MKYTFLLLAVSVIFFKCSSTIKHDNKIIIASIDSIPVYENEIDSLTDKKIYEIKKEALKLVINKKLLVKESERLNIPLDSLIKEEIIKKTKNFTFDEYKKFISMNSMNASALDSSEIIKQLKYIKGEERKAEYIESLKKKHAVNIMLHPNIFFSVHLDSLISYDLNKQKKGNMIVYAISDYECSSCQYTEPKLKTIIEKYGNNVNFKYVYHSSYIAPSILASNAAEKQGKFIDMHDVIFKNSSLIGEDSIYLFFARKLHLNIEEFKNDVSDPQIIKAHLLNTKKLIEAGIYSTPSFIVNNKLVNEDNSINFLENVIQKELKQYE